MNFKYLVIAACLVLAFNCKQPKVYLSKIEGSQLKIGDSISMDPEIESFIKPFRIHIKKDLDSVLAYATQTYSKSDGFLNTVLGNYMADTVFDEANPVFNSRTGNNIDMVILNHGGMRSNLLKGNVTTKTAYELMPFENSVVVVALRGSQINELINYLVKEKIAHPISKLKLVVNTKFDVVETSINGNPIEPNRIYYVATNDYLFNGGDEMYFFKPNEGVFALGYKIRNALIDNFKKVDTIKPNTDQRFFQLK